MDRQTKIIFVLLALILIATVFLILKITGVIKPVEIEPIKNNINETSEDNSINTTNTTRNRTSYRTTYEDDFTTKLLVFMVLHATAIRIGIFILSVIINIGIAKLYRKLMMPEWCVFMQYITPLLSFTTSIPIIGGILSLIIAILQIIILAYFFGSVGMSKLWAICPTVSIIVISIGVVKSASLFSRSSTGAGSIYTIIGMLSLLAFAVAYIIANIRVGKRLDRGTAFIVGLAILPFVFQPILGYIGNNRIKRYHDDYNFEE